MSTSAEDTAAGTAAASGKKAAAEVTTVTMSDGREVGFAGKRKLIKDSILVEGSLPVVRLDFRNGETRSYTIAAELLNKFAAHGAEQKLGDETAGTDDVDDMVLDVDALIARLEKGEWSTVREGGGNAGTSILMKALMEFSSKSKEAIIEFLKGKSQAEKLALRNSAKLKPIVERLESEKNAKAAKVDTEALLAGL